MEKRVLGSSGIEVSPVGMGCMGLTHASGDPMDDAAAERVVREAYEMGYTFFDTAECYVGERADGSIAHNEDVVGAALAPVRDQVVIATKFGVRHAADRSLALDSSPATIRASVEGSLRRLGTDYTRDIQGKSIDWYNYAGTEVTMTNPTADLLQHYKDSMPSLSRLYH